MGKKTTSTITDQQWADLRRRADKVAPPMFSSEATRRRLAVLEQQRKAGQS